MGVRDRWRSRRPWSLSSTAVLSKTVASETAGGRAKIEAASPWAGPGITEPRCKARPLADVLSSIPKSSSCMPARSYLLCCCPGSGEAAASPCKTGATSDGPVGGATADGASSAASHLPPLRFPWRSRPDLSTFSLHPSVVHAGWRAPHAVQVWEKPRGQIAARHLPAL